MTELLLLALAGLLLGAGLSAAKRGAPVPLRRTFFVMAAVAAALALLTFPRGRW